MQSARLILRAIAAASMILAAMPADAADRLILRNLDFLNDCHVISFDEDGLVLEKPRPGGGQRVTWDEVERGKVALDQERFDRLLAELGPPLYRIRQRLKTGDYESLAEPVEQVYARYAGRKSQTAYLVLQATMWSRLARGEREAAVEPYLRCYELLRSRAASLSELPGSRRLAVDPQTALSAELVPVWFDAERAKAALPAVREVIRTMAAPRPEGASIYFATLALTAREAAEAERVIQAMSAAEGELAQWREIVALQQAMLTGTDNSAANAVRERMADYPPPARAAALYWLGRKDAEAEDSSVRNDALLALLTLPAEYGDDHPELAAAGLYHAHQALVKLKEDAGAAAVQNELLSRYASTYHAAQARSGK